MWDERYKESELAYGNEPNDFLASIDLSQYKGKVLCLAEGQCRNAIYLARLGFSVKAVDLSLVGLTRGLELAKENQVSIEIEAIDLSTYTIEPDTYIGIVCIFGHLPKEVRARLHKQIVQKLKKGGFFIMEAYSPDQIENNTGGPKEKELLYPLNEVVQELNGLTFEEAIELDREVVEGKYHTGLASVIQIYAKKEA